MQKLLDLIDDFFRWLFKIELPVPPVVPEVPKPMEPAPPPVEILLWDTPKEAWHSTRVLCDRADLTYTQKNTLCACVYQESRFLRNPKPNKNIRDGVVWSTDFGIVQVNDYFHIGIGKKFPSVQYVLDNPQKCIQWMIDTYRTTGKLQPWSSWVSGVYKQWLPLTSPMWELAK